MLQSGPGLRYNHSMHSGIPHKKGLPTRRAARDEETMQNKTKRNLWRGALLAAAVIAVDLFLPACGEGETSSLLLTQEEVATSSTEEAAVEVTSAAEEKTTSKEEEEESAPTICVDVVGAVENEGVVYLPEGARVYEAVAAAGGFSEDANQRAVNQAAVLSDGVQLVIPTKEETEAGTESVYGIVGNTPAASAASEETGLVNINTADEATLQTLPGIGETKAAAIVRYREENGAFAAIEDIKNVPGIKDAGFEKIRDRITCG